jgi:hypothetical protein
MHPTRTLLFAGLTSIVLSCSSLKPSTLPYDRVEAPGFFDIGVGYGRVSDTRNTSDDDAQGLMASFKAYPLGRWYGEPKKEALETGVTALQRLAVSRIVELDDAKRASYFRLREKELDDEDIDAFEREWRLVQEAAGKAEAPLAEPVDPGKLGELKAALGKAGAQAAEAAKVVDDLLARDEAARVALLDMVGWASERNGLRKAAEQASPLLSESDVRIHRDVREALTRLLSPNELTDFERCVVRDFLIPEGLAPKWHVIKERNDFINRFSVFYGRSVGDFDSGGLQSEVNAIGFGFDVSPDLAIQLGWAFYEVDEGTGMADSDGSVYFGVSLNLYSFKALGAAIVNAGASGS